MEKIWTPIELVRWTENYLRDKGFEDARLNAEILLAGVLRLKRLDLYLQFDRPLSAEELAEYKARLKRRLKREPLQYIEGTAAFRDLTLKVDGRVLIPRPETELLVGEVLAWAGDRSGLDVLDIGTGSGAIALSLRREGSFGRIVATDVSVPALELARANADRAGVDGIDFRAGAFYHAVAGERFDVIVSNPPYIGERERPQLASEVLDWEPSVALFAGDEGLDAIRAIVIGSERHLREGGLLAIEIGASQGPAVLDLVREAGCFSEPALRRDLSGRDRFVLAEVANSKRGREPESPTKPENERIGHTSGTSA